MKKTKKGIKKKDKSCIPILRLDDKGNTLERYENRKDIIEWVRKNCNTNATDESIISIYALHVMVVSIHLTDINGNMSLLK